MTSPSIVAALADMRLGRRVLVVSPARQALLALWTEAGAAKVDGEHERRNVGHERITRDAGGSIEFWTYDRMNHVRGRKFDSVYIDNSSVFAALTACVAGSAAPTIAQFPASWQA